MKSFLTLNLFVILHSNYLDTSTYKGNQSNYHVSLLNIQPLYITEDGWPTLNAMKNYLSEKSIKKMSN